MLLSAWPHWLRLRLRLRKCLLKKIDTDTISGLHKNTLIYNNHTFLIYNESNARCETSIKVISDRWHGGHPKGKSMHTQWENTLCNFLTTGLREYIMHLSDDGVRSTAATTGTTTAASLLQARLPNPFEGRASAHEIYGCPIRKWIAVTRLNEDRWGMGTLHIG